MNAQQFATATKPLSAGNTRVSVRARYDRGWATVFVDANCEFFAYIDHTRDPVRLAEIVKTANALVTCWTRPPKNPTSTRTRKAR